jgi:hypothetical protein
VASAAAPEVRSSRSERVLPSAFDALRGLRVALGGASDEAFSAAASAASSASWTPVLYPESGAGFLLRKEREEETRERERERER